MLFNATGAYVMVVGLAAVLVLVLLLQRQRSGKEVSLWFFSGLTGMVLGAAAGIAGITYFGYEIARAAPKVDASLVVGDDGDLTEEMEGMGGGPGADGEPGMGGGPGSGGGPGMGGFGGGRTIPPKRQLTTLVQKIELLTGDISLKLSEDQAAAVGEMLAQFEAADSMTDEEAEEKYDALLGVLSEEQVAKQEKIRLARSPRGGGGGGGGMGGGEEADENANPFKEEADAAAITALIGRLGGKTIPPAKEATEEKPPERKADASE